MWCGKCQADVAAEVSPDNQRVFCTVCGALLTMIDTPPSRPSTERPASDKTKDARDLLQRWSSGKVLDPFGPPIKPIEPVEVPTKVVQRPVTSEGATNAAPESIGVSHAASDSVVDKSLLTTAVANEVASPVSAIQSSNTLASGAALVPRLPAELATAKELISLGSPEITVSPTVSNVRSDQGNDVGAPSVRSTPSPFVVAAMNSTYPSGAVSTPLFASPPLSGLAPVESPLKSTLQSDRPVAPIPPSPFEQPAKSETPTAFPTAAKIRIDAAHDQTGFLGSAAANSPMPSVSSSNPTTFRDASGPFAVKSAPVQQQVESRRVASWMPTWDPAFWRTETSVSGNWTSAAGQLLAYAGVLGLTIGACMVVWSYFGGPANYAPTGWLIATAGQMLLFFGVVTLVSGGLEQTTEQVNKRIEQLGDHIIRIEQAAREMNARSIPPAHFGHDRDEADAAREALAASDDERAVVER